MKFKELIENVPEYKRFLTLNEMDSNTDRLARQYPDSVETFVAGYSSKGHPIKCLKIGNGLKSGLIYGCPHPNEPIGAMMLEYLTLVLAENEALREELGYTWYIIKSVDPDGTVLNEGWFAGPFTLFNYARNFYRPASAEQVEWTFPIKYKNLEFNSPLPETKALMNVMGVAKPEFLYSLHNSGFGGVYWYLSDQAPQLYDKLKEAAGHSGLPLSLGESEVPYAEKFSTAIFKIPSIEDTYDYLEEYADVDPTEVIKSGASGIEYVRRIADTFGLVCEVPYFYDARIQDTTPSDIIRKDAILMSCDNTEKTYEFLNSQYQAIDDLISEDNPFLNVISEYLRNTLTSIKAKRQWAERNTECLQLATVAEKFDNLQVSKFYNMLSVGMLIRMAEFELNACDTQNEERIPRLCSVRDRVEQELVGISASLEAELSYNVVPIKDLVQIQLGSALATLQYLKEVAVQADTCNKDK